MPPELERPLKLDPDVSLDQEPAAGDTIREVVGQVLETMFFTEAVVADCEHAWLKSAPCARIQFAGSHDGEMLLGVSTEGTDPIAASFLGLDPMELTGAQRGQVIQELANILCGAILSHLWPESKLALSSPDLTPWQEWPSEGLLHRCFTTPEGMLAISIRLILIPGPTDSRPGYA